MNERESALDLINDTRHLDMRLKKKCQVVSNKQANK